MKKLKPESQRLKTMLLLLGVLFTIVGFNTLDWIFNTPIKAWEYLEIMPKTYLLCWIAYIFAVVSLFFGGFLVGHFSSDRREAQTSRNLRDNNVTA